ncbi:MAG: hypothetical protein ABEK04_00985, partial [Candidatus Nanohalobium sp.]
MSLEDVLKETDPGEASVNHPEAEYVDAGLKEDYHSHRGPEFFSTGDLTNSVFTYARELNGPLAQCFKYTGREDLGELLEDPGVDQEVVVVYGDTAEERVE